jgi:selenoprotein W-related protein
MATEISIVYCKPCGYLKRAEDTAAALKERLGVDAALVPGTGGIFEIRVGDKVVSKRTREGFPETPDIVRAVSEALGR